MEKQIEVIIKEEKGRVDKVLAERGHIEGRNSSGKL